MSDITDPTCPASAGEAAQEQAAPAAELSTPGASLENFSVAEPENALPRATLETLPETIAAAACGRAGWTSLMPVQSLALPYLLEGRDIMVQSRTGSGKTGCYLLPLVPRLDPELHAAQALILVPTRELAVQVEHEARTLFEGTGIRPVAVYGGVGYKKQMDALRDGAQLVVGTPGRVLDHLLRRTLSLDDLDALVFDEADRMLSIGFYPDMKEVQRYLPRRRIHTSMFSATYPPHVLKLAGEFLTEPSMLSLSQKEVHVAEVQHLFCQSRPMDKDRVLVRLLEYREPGIGHHLLQHQGQRPLYHRCAAGLRLQRRRAVGRPFPGPSRGRTGQDPPGQPAVSGGHGRGRARYRHPGPVPRFPLRAPGRP